METIFIILSVGALAVVCFFVGAKVGQKVSKGEDINVPTINPIDAIRERREAREAREEARAEADVLDTILENIKNYNGSSSGQKDVPRG